MAVEVALLGPLAVSVDGVDATPTAPKERMLLALLALRAGTVVPDEHLVDELWPDLDQARGRRVLQVRVTALRKLLQRAGASDVLVKRGAGYQLQSPPVRLDVHRFDADLVAASARDDAGDHEGAARLLRRALDVWRGDPLVDVEGCLALEAEAARYRELRLGAVESRIRADLACGRHRAVVAELEGLIATHRFREPLWELAALTLYRCGRQVDALAACRQITAVLGEELGLDPGPGLRELQQRILAQSSALDPPALHRPSAGLPAMLGQARIAPLVGRATDVATLTAAVGSAHEAMEPRLVLVSGEAGIGKTRLVAEAASIAAAAGAMVLAGRSDEDPLSSFQPFREALRAAGPHLEPALRTLAPPDRAELGRLDPSLGGGLTTSGDGDRFQLFEAVAALMRALSEQAPVLFVLEDLHWADRSTHRLLAHLVNHAACGGIAVVATTRPEGADAPPPELSRHPDRVHQMTLTALSEGEIESLVGSLLQLGAPDLVARAVYRASGGNPLYAREIVRHVEETGDLSLARVLAVPPELETIVLSRTQRLGELPARTLATAAVLGPNFDTELLAAVAEHDPGAVLDALEPAVTAGLLVEAGPDGFTFGHAVVREALYRSTLVARRSRLHLRAARHLERTRPDHLTEAAEHLLAAGQLVEPTDLVRVLTGAAEQAFAAVAYDESRSLFGLALEAGRAAGLADGELARLQLRRAVASEAAGDPDGKEAIRQAALAAGEAGHPELFAEGALAFARMPIVVTSADPATVELLGQALDRLGDAEVPVRARVASRLAYELFWEPDSRRAGLAAESLDLAHRLGDPATLAAVLADRRYDAGWQDLEQWLTESREILRLATVAGDRELMWQGGYCCVNSLVLLGRFAEARAELASLAHTAQEMHRSRLTWWATAASASMRIVVGDFVEGERLAVEACALGERVNDPDATPIFLEQFYNLCWLRGRLDDVVDAVGLYAAENPLSVVAHIAHTHARAHCGDLAGARDGLRRFAGGGLARLALNVNWYANSAMLAETAALVDDRELADALVPMLAPQRALTVDVGACSGFLGPMARYLGQALAATGQVDEGVTVLREAVARADESGTVPWATLARHDLAVLLRSRGLADDLTAAAELDRVAAADAARLGMGDLASRAPGPAPASDGGLLRLG